MNFDVLTLTAVRGEIEARAVGGRVQRVAAPEPDQITLEIYAHRATHHLLIHAGHQNARVHFVRHRSPAGEAPASPLLLLLRKWVRGSRLISVTQLPLERVLELRVRSRPDGEVEPVEHTLIVEIIGRQSNVILVDGQGVIRDALRRITSESARRRIAPRAPYEAPAAMQLPAPALATPTDTAALAAPRVPAWRALLRSVSGVSPTLARESLARAGADPDAPSMDINVWPEALEALRGTTRDIDAGVVRPCLVPDAAGWQAYAAYELTHLDRDCQTVGSMSEALETYYAADEPRVAADGTKARVLEAVDDAVGRVERRIASLRDAAPTGAEVGAARSAGVTLLAHAHEIPAGTTRVEFEGTELTLDPGKTLGANAQSYFTRYRDLERAARLTPRRLRRAELELAYLRQAVDDLLRSESAAVSQEIADLLVEGGYIRRARRRRPRNPLRRPVHHIQGHEVLAGRTAAENYRVTFRESARDDLWFHARGVPGAHVILQRPGSEPARELIQAVAGLAAHLSAARDSTSVEVDYTRRRHVRPIRGAAPGQVTYRNHHTIRVAPRADGG